MTDTDILLVFAELSIALAGFSAIIGVLGSRKDIADVRVNSLRIQVMLETCFMVAAAALVPALLSRFGIDAQVLWRISSALFLMVVIPFEFVARNRTKTLSNMTLTKFNINTVNWALSIGSDLVMVAVLFNLVGHQPDAFYIVALFMQLTIAGILFVQFAAETFRPPEN